MEKQTKGQKPVATPKKPGSSELTEEALKKAYTAAYKACGTDANWQKKVIAAKDAKKASL